MSLLAQVADRLTQVDVRFALICAGALAAHGVTRSTFDLDLLATDPRCLELDTWSPLPEAIDREVRRGDLEDPMAGLVRFTAAGERDIDLVVGRAAWQTWSWARAPTDCRSRRSEGTFFIPFLVCLFPDPG